MKIIIIGAGPGGLTLAQGLKKAGIDFHVYEKDGAADYRLQGYRIRVHGEGVTGLKECLSDQVLDLVKKTCPTTGLGMPLMGDLTTGNLLESGKGEIKWHGKAKPPGLSGETLTVDRRVFRDVLLTGLDDHVTFGKEFVKYETNALESVTVSFGDGTTAEGTCLVGADGVSSRVRKQLLPDHIPVDTGSRIVFGKTPITKEVTETFPAEFMPKMSMFRDFNADIPVAALLEAIVFPEAPTHIKLPDDYIYWVLSVRDTDLDFLSADERRGRITNDAAVMASKRITEHWHESLRVLFELQDTDQTSIIPISSHLVPLPVWESTNVTLVGDAAHVMPPTGASGLVTALRDAAALVRMIKEKGINGVAAYEEQMREYAAEIITASGTAAVKGFGFKPVEQWTALGNPN
jgi:2-polyprenyl-6-methoxyphenol hydroxylase-like FAD-dependent oxidoreductase